MNQSFTPLTKISKSMNISKINIVTCLLVFCILFLGLMHFTNLHGVSVCVDCQTYIEGARSLSSGHDYCYCNGQFINHFPPLYSFQLAVFSLILHQEPNEIGLIFNCFYLFVFVFFSFKTLVLLTENKWISLLGIILLLTSPFIFLFNTYLSEVPFLGFMMIYVFISLTRSNSPIQYMWIGILLSLMTLTRFAGIVFIGVSILQIIAKPNLSLKEKTFRGFSLILPFILIIFSWKTYAHQFQNKDLTSRNIFFHPVSNTHWHEFFLSIKSLFFNNSVSFISLCLLFLMATFVAIKKFKSLRPAATSAPVLIFITALFYLGFILFAISFFDFAIPLDTRILAPFSILLLISLIAILNKILQEYNRIFFPVFILLCAVYLAGNIKKSYLFWEKYHQEGDGFNSSKNEAVVFPQILNSTDKYIYSDKYTFIKFRYPELCEKILPIPLEYVEINNNINPNFKKEMDQLMLLIEKDSAMIIIINSNNPLEKKRNQNIIQITTSNKNLTLHSTEQITWIE